MSDANNTENVRAGLTRNESLLLSSLSEKGKTIFRIEDIVSELRCSYGYAKVLANNLRKKKWIIILRRGVYLISPLSAGVQSHYTEHEFIVASSLVKPYYIAYWSALNFHGFTEQTPFSVFVATTGRAQNVEVLDIRYNFVTLSEKKFFGFVQTAVGSYRINISDREKTLADSLDHPEYCGGMVEVVKCLWNARNNVFIEKIVSDAERMGNTAIIKRLGYLLESLKINVDEKIISRMRELVSPGISTLDPTLPKKRAYNTRWNLMLNVSEEILRKNR